MFYNKVIIIGLGKTAFQCADKIKTSYCTDVVLYDVNDAPSRFLQFNSKKNGINYIFTEKEKMFSSIENEENTTLLLSVYNPVIIPDRILNKNNIKAINLHHSLLPYHPGMYSEAWTIFEQDKYSGITWHLMTPEIDAGEIIIQKKVPIDNKTTSYNLLYNLNEVAYEAFEEVVEDIMCNSLKAALQKKIPDISLHLKKDKPNNGILDLKWHLNKISSFLRAYDYYVSFPYGKPKVEFENFFWTWKKYTIENENDCTEKISRDNNNLIIEKEGAKITLIGIRKYDR